MSKTSEKICCTISSQLDELHCADRLTEDVAKIASLSDDKKNNLAIAVTEAVGNAIVHGNKENPEKKVYIEFRLRKADIQVIVKDEGAGFNPDEIEDPLLPKNLLKERGRGIFILTELMDRVHFQFTNNGTVLKMTMRR